MAMHKQIRAIFTDTTIRVYQAYGDQIADVALQQGTFAAPFSFSRMTWIKPSFLWMMYRCGWGLKDENQKRVLAIDIDRAGFERALSMACLSHFDPELYPSETAWKEKLQASMVRIQWDPERDVFFRPLPHRSLQIGLTGDTVPLYAEEWIKKITDVTEQAFRLKKAVEAGDEAYLDTHLPKEQPYPLPRSIALAIGAGVD